MNTYNALFFDLSGVLYQGLTPLPGAAKTIQMAREKGLTIRFITNTATQNSKQIISNLHNMQIDIHPEELFTAPLAAKHFILSKGWTPYCLIHKNIQSDFADINQHNPDCVLLGDARDDLTYASLNKAFQLCKQGAPLIGIGMNKYFKNEQQLMLDAGAFIHAIEWAAEIKAIIMGKPNAAFFAQVVNSTPFPAQRCLMLGDDAINDVKGAIEAGLQGCLVKTGKYQPNDEDSLPAGASLIDSVAELFND